MEYYKRRMQKAEADMDQEPPSDDGGGGPHLTLFPMIETPKGNEGIGIGKPQEDHVKLRKQVSKPKRQ
jgi:hypothetical protein